MSSEIRILIAEDLPSDAALAEREVLKYLPSATFQRVETREGFLEALETFKPDLIVSDYHMPTFDGLSALKISLEKTPVTPFIIYTGSMNEDTAVECMKAGATDYVIKEHMKRLGPAVKNALENKKIKIESIKAENALRESELKFRHLVQASQDIIAMYDNQGEVLYNSPGVRNTLGYDPEEARGKKVFEIIHPDDMPLAMATFFDILKKTPGESIRTNIRAVHHNGSTRWLDATLTNMLDQPGVEAIVGNFRDITAQHMAKLIQQTQYRIAHSFITAKGMDDLFDSICKELDSVVETKNFLIAFYDEENDTFSTPFEIDQETKAPLSWPAGDSLTGMITRQKKTLLLNKTDIAKLAEQYKITLRGERAEAWLGLPMIINENVIGVLVLQNYDDPNAFSETDIHMLEILAKEMSIYIEKKRNEEALIVAKEKAEESDRLKTAFLENVSHEIRTPMNSILGFLDLLKEPRLDDLLKSDYIDIVNKSAQRLLATITDIIELSQLESGQPEVHLQDVDISKLLQDQYKVFKSEAEQKGIELRFADHCPDKTKVLFTDKQKLTSIFRNILNNAIKFTKQGYAELGIYCEKDKLVFFVRDTGVGIPGHKQKAIFERFVQGDHKVTRGYEGSGLGLSIAKAYLDLLNGKIWLESEVGKGSVFYFSFPASPVSQAETVTPKADDINTRELSDHTILIAEDDDLSFLLLETILEDQEINIIRAVSGEEAVSLLRKHPETSLILMDLKMPGMGGLAATRAIREFNETVPIIAQTAHALMGDKNKAIEHGCNDYISKPINRRDLFNMLSGYISKTL